MDPRLEQILPLGEIAEEWSLDLSRSVDRVRTALVQSFWRGELKAVLNQRSDAGVDQRLLALDALHLSEDHPGLLLVETVAEVPPVCHHPDGGFVADLRTVVVWPRDPAARGDTALRDATQALAGVSWEAYGEFQVTLRHLDIDREDFSAHCRDCGFALPPFWFDRRSVASSAAAATRFEKWLEHEVRRPGVTKWQSKQRYYAVAAQEFEGLSKRSFEAAWRRVVPDQWKRAGRPTHGSGKPVPTAR